MGEEDIKIAIVHDWLVTNAGAEKVLKEIVKLYPDADIYALVDFLSMEDREKILSAKSVKTSFIQRLPFAKKHFRNYLPLFPKAVESFDFGRYDLVISSSWAFAKGVRAKNHICYCHTPIRYAWDLYEEYISQVGGPKKLLVSAVLKRIRRWDRKNLPNRFIANSTEVAKRIKRIYGKPSSVVHPPVDTEKFALFEDKEDYYVTMSRLVPYKKTKIIVEAFNQMPDKRLVVIGDGEELKAIEAVAKENIQIVGYQDDENALKFMQRAKAFLYAAFEDFGIVMAEALSCGTPVIAYGRGGACDIVEDGKNGILYKNQDSKDIIEAVKRFEKMSFSPKEVRLSGERFDKERFKREFKREVDEFIEKSGAARFDRG